MTEQLISFETAKLAKEKHIELPSKYYYCIGYANLKPSKKLKETEHICVRGKGQPHIANAPTQSLLQKWLREKHCIYAVANPFRIKNKNKTVFVENVLKDNSYTKCWSKKYNTYEEALEVGLQEALKLIDS